MITLEELINLAIKHKKLTIWPELKEPELYPNFVENFLSLIKKYNFESRTIVQCFDIETLTKIYLKDKNIQLFKLFFYQLSYDFSLLPKYIKYVGLPIGSGYLCPIIISKANEENIKVIFWRESSFFENAKVLKKLSEYGAYGFMIDEPIQIY